jgi:hypothetical protein
MGLAEAIRKQAESSVYGIRCRAGQMLAKMPEVDAKALREALADMEKQTTVIVRALHDEGYQIGYDSVHRHRKRVCGCPEWQ